MLVSSSLQFDPTSNDSPYNRKTSNNKAQSMSSGFGRKSTTSLPGMSSGDRHQPKRRSTGFFRSLVHESKDVLLAPFNSGRRKASATPGSESKLMKDRGTQTRSGDCALSCPYSAFCGAAGSSCIGISSGSVNSPRLNSTFFAQQSYPSQSGLQNCHHFHSHRTRRSSRARSDPSARYSLTNLSSLSGAYGTGWSSATCHQYPNPTLPMSTATLASSLTHEQQSQSYNGTDGTSQNDLRSEAISNGSSPKIGHDMGSNSGFGVFPATSASHLAARGRASIPLSRTLPARLEPSSLLSPEWSRAAPNISERSIASTVSDVPQHIYFTPSNSHLSSLRRSVSSVSSGGASPLFSACCCPNETSHRFTSTSSRPYEQRLFLMGSLVMSLYRSLAEPMAEELLRYPWGRDSLWLMAFVVFASSLVLVGYLITTVLPTMILAVCIAICKSLIFRRKETMAHLRILAGSARCSVFTRECLHSLRSATLQVVNQTLQLLVPPIIVPTTVDLPINA